MSREIAPKPGLPVEGKSSPGAIDKFLAKTREIAPATGDGRLIFALDATMSRQPTWDRACQLQAGMFDAVGAVGSLSVQLVYFRGYGECRASRFVSDTARLRDLMTGIECRGGRTQIGKVLGHIDEETRRRKVSAAVYIGDAMEEDVDALAHKAGELGLRKVPCFMFQEGRDPAAHRAFAEIARLSGGAYARFGESSAEDLAALLNAVARYAAGGLKALANDRTRGARHLLEQLPSR